MNILRIKMNKDEYFRNKKEYKRILSLYSIKWNSSVKLAHLRQI